LNPKSYPKQSLEILSSSLNFKHSSLSDVFNGLPNEKNKQTINKAIINVEIIKTLMRMLL